MWRTSNPKRDPVPAAVHCSICKSPELPNAAIGLRPTCRLILQTELHLQQRPPKQRSRQGHLFHFVPPSVVFSSSLRQPDPVQQVDVAGVGTQDVKTRIDLDPDCSWATESQPVVQTGKRSLVFAQCSEGDGERYR